MSDQMKALAKVADKIERKLIKSGVGPLQVAFDHGPKPSESAALTMLVVPMATLGKKWVPVLLSKEEVQACRLAEIDLKSGVGVVLPSLNKAERQMVMLVLQQLVKNHFLTGL